MLAAPFAYGAGFGAYAPAAYGGYGWGASPYGLGFFNQQHDHKGLGLQNLVETEMEELSLLAIVGTGCYDGILATSAMINTWINCRNEARNAEKAAIEKNEPER